MKCLSGQKQNYGVIPIIRVFFYSSYNKLLAKSHSKNVKLQLTKITSYNEKQPNNLQKEFSSAHTYKNKIITLIIDLILVKLKLNHVSFYKLKGIFTKCGPELLIRKIRKFV